MTEPGRALHLVATDDAQAAARRVHHVQPEQDEAPEYAGLITRTLAFALDAAVINLVALTVGVVVTLVFSVIPASHDAKAIVIAAGGAAYFLWLVGYFVTFWTTTGVTPGNRAMRIRVTRLDGERLHPRHALIRLVGIVAGAIPLFAGFSLILVTDRRRAFHDYLAGTVVRPQAPKG